MGEWSDHLVVAPPATMFFRKPYFPRMVVCLTAWITAGTLLFVRGEEYAPIVETRVDDGLEQAAETPPAADRATGWDVAAVISAAYDDNIFLSANDPESDVVLRVAPSVAYAKGDATEGEGGHIKAGYRPTLVVYAANGSENRIDHEAAAVAGWRGKVTRLTYSGLVRKLGDATAETGAPTDRIEFENEIRAAWLPKEKIALEVAAGNRQANYSDDALFDSDKTYGEVALRYTYSPKTQLGIVWQAGRLKVDRSPSQDTRQLTAEIEWQPREKVRLHIEAGAEDRKVGGQSETNPVLEGRVDWSPREGTELYLAGYMREEASAYYAGQNYSVRGVAAGVSQRFNRVWSGKLEGGYERNSYSLVSGTGAAGRKDRIWFVKPAVVCRISDDSDLTFFYRFSDNSSNDPAFGYTQRMLGLEYNHSF